MFKEKAVKNLLEKYRNTIEQNVKIGFNPKSDDFLMILEKKLKRTPILVPKEGYFGSIGVVEKRLPKKEDMAELKKILNRELDKIIMDIRKDNTVIEITSTTIKALISNKLDAEGACYSIREVGHDIAVVVTLKQKFHIEFMIKMAPDIVEKIDNIPISIAKANELIDLNGTNFNVINRHYGKSNK